MANRIHTDLPPHGDDPKAWRRAWEKKYKKQPHRREYERKRESHYRQTKAGKESVRATQLKIRYGLSKVEYQALLESQDGVCAICKRVPERAFDVDHAHGTNPPAVRGLLCGPCNRVLGLFDEEAWRFANAANYLNEHQTFTTNTRSETTAEISVQSTNVSGIIG